jgi:predicted ester cyclase
MVRVAFVVALLALGLFGMMPGGAIPRATAQEATPAIACPVLSDAEAEAVARRWFEEALNGADLAVLDEILSPELTYHSVTPSELSGRELAESVLGSILIGFPDVEYTVEQAFSGGDVVTLIWSAEGTHTGAFQGYEPTGKRAAWTGINVYRFTCGRIAEVWAESDALGRLRQMGVVATPTP